MLKVKCPAKINLTLDVLGLTENNYHKVEMIMQTVSLYDEITISKSDIEGIFLKTNLPYIPCNIKNSAYKAASLFFEYTNIKPAVRINVFKKIPVAAGLAGGSTNAAGVLMLLNILYETNLAKHELLSLCTKIGADVSFCLIGGTALASGIGEKLEPISSKLNCFIVLAKPKASLSTPKVYGELDSHKIEKHPNTNQMIKYLKSGDLRGVCDNLYNVMEIASIKLCPTVHQFKSLMNTFFPLGCVMSGSGPTVFSVFDDKAQAYALAEFMKQYTHDVFVATPCPGIKILNY